MEAVSRNSEEDGGPWLEKSLLSPAPAFGKWFALSSSV